MSHARSRLGLALLATSLLVTPALALEGQEIASLGHVVKVIEGDDLDQRLIVDDVDVGGGDIVLLDPLVNIGEIAVVSGVMGSSGNACAAAPFVVTLPAEGDARFDGPIESCDSFEITQTEDGLIFTSEAVPGQPGERWSWNLVDGFTGSDLIEFEADANLGWEAIDTLADAHPVDALRIGAVDAALREIMTPPEFAQFSRIITGLGSGKLEEQGYVGQGCDKLVCEDSRAFLWIDRASKSVYTLFSTDDQGSIAIRPEALDTWPEWVLEDFSQVSGAN